MDKLTEYPKLLKHILAEHVEICRRQPVRGIETYLIADDALSDYVWINIGWQSDDRVCAITSFIRIRDGKFLIEEDWTEDGIASDLLRAGVPREDIVLAFHELEMQPYASLAAA